MGSKIYLSSPASTPTALTQDLYVNNVNVGAVSYQSPIFVNLQDGGATPVTPISVSKPANVATVTLPTPAPNGVALQRPNPSQGVSYVNYDTGWRAQNNWYAYNPPAYPAKYAQLDTTLGSSQWYRLKTALTVGGVSSTNRFVDITGTQNFGIPLNANLAFIDKLTGYMVLRTPVTIGGGSAGYYTQMTTAFNYSATIGGNTYSDWYMISASEFMAIFGCYLYQGGTWIDPFTSVPIATGLGALGVFRFLTADNDGGIGIQGYVPINATLGRYQQINVNETWQQIFYIHDVSNLIS